MKRLTAAFSLVLLLASLTACDDASLFFAGELTGLPLAQSPDPAVRAVSRSPQAVKDEREARGLLEAGLKDKNPDSIAKAIEKRPANPTYYAYHTAMLLALGRTQGGFNSEYWTAVRELAGVLLDNTGKESADKESEAILGGFMLPALLETRALFAPGSAEWQRLQTIACTFQILLEKSPSAVAIATLVANPVDGCPAGGR